MGQNSTEVAYGFGQMGSVFTNHAYPVYPPQDHVIIAIQFLEDTTPGSMLTETLDSGGPQYPTTEDDERKVAGGPDANFAGVVWAAATSGTAAGVITLTADGASEEQIKPGQIVLIGDDTAETIDAGINVDAAAGHVVPIYNGPNKQWLEVVSIAGINTGAGNVTVTVKAVGACTTAAIANIDAANQIYFLDSYHAAGGTTTESITFPKGVVIYGRWTTFTGEATKPVICYFGQ